MAAAPPETGLVPAGPALQPWATSGLVHRRKTHRRGGRLEIAGNLRACVSMRVKTRDRSS
jgi:hypothetical protein